MNINFLKEVANFIGATNVDKELELLTQKNEECPLVLPLVGEFSSGKTTLINALTDSKQLETATKPTTATIYQIHFGSEKCRADVFFENGKKMEVENISDLHNSEIAEASVVEVYDTSSRVPSSIVVVDTPGLSSPDPKHQQTLVDFLPEADGILLVSDINQPGLTRSLTEFIKTMELSKRRIFLVLTKCDTKSEKEIKESKVYIEKNNGIPQCNIVAVSAKDDKLEELFELLSRVQKEKSVILEQVNIQRVKGIAKRLIDNIGTMKKASLSDDELDDAILEQERKLSSLNGKIQKFINSLEDDIAELSRKAERTFEDTVTSRLETLVANKSDNFDAEAVSIINNASSMIVSNLCGEIQNVVRANTSKSDLQQSIELSNVDNVDLSSFEIDGLSYNLNLNSVGHEYDGKIATGLKIAAAAAAVVTAGAAIGAAGAAEAGAAGAAEAGAAAAAESTGAAIVSDYGMTDLVVDAAQTVYMVKSANANSQQNQSSSEMPSRKQQIVQKYNELEQQNQEYGQKIGAKGGIVESLVGLVTDKTMGKPQRRRAIHNYMDSSLMPNFKLSMQRNVRNLLNEIQNSLLSDASTVINDLKNSLSSLKDEKRTQEDDFKARMRKLNDYCVTLNNEYLCGGF